LIKLTNWPLVTNSAPLAQSLLNLDQPGEQSESAFGEPGKEKAHLNDRLLVILSAFRLTGEEMALKKEDHCWASKTSSWAKRQLSDETSGSRTDCEYQTDSEQFELGNPKKSQEQCLDQPGQRGRRKVSLLTLWRKTCPPGKGLLRVSGRH
jgi:hypothetical protein